MSLPKVKCVGVVSMPLGTGSKNVICLKYSEIVLGSSWNIFNFHISTSQKSDESSKMGEQQCLPPAPGPANNHNQIVQIFANFLSELLSRLSWCQKENVLILFTVNCFEHWNLTQIVLLIFPRLLPALLNLDTVPSDVVSIEGLVFLPDLSAVPNDSYVLNNPRV